MFVLSYQWREYTKNYFNKNPVAYEKKKQSDGENIRKRRVNPEFKKKELEYQINYCKKRGITLNRLWAEISGVPST